MSASVYSDIHNHFRGYARLNLANIQLPTDEDVHEADVKRLIKNFESRGCLQHDSAYAISVLVDGDSLAAATDSETHLASSGPTPIPHINIQAICLHGKHRIVAAQLALQDSDRWWTARLFDSSKWTVFTKATHTDQFSGLPAGARDFIRHEYMHKLDPTDGEIFRRVLIADHERDEVGATYWAAMLTERKRRNLKELKHLDNNGLLAKITPLLPFAALWVDFQPGALNRVLPMRCREVRHIDRLRS